MPAWPDKWDLDGFPDALKALRATPGVTDEVFKEVERWWPSRQDAPYGDADPTPDETALAEDYLAVRARVYNIHRYPVMVGDRQVVCHYEVREKEHQIVCDRFDLL